MNIELVHEERKGLLLHLPRQHLKICSKIISIDSRVINVHENQAFCRINRSNCSFIPTINITLINSNVFILSAPFSSKKAALGEADLIKIEYLKTPLPYRIKLLKYAPLFYSYFLIEIEILSFPLFDLLSSQSIGKIELPKTSNGNASALELHTEEITTFS